LASHIYGRRRRSRTLQGCDKANSLLAGTIFDEIIEAVIKLETRMEELEGR
jgi:hypothetical protein